MQRIISHIEYLLNSHECVTVPRLGAFVKQYLPASINAKKNVIVPPRAVISFNSEIIFDDGLLATSYSRAMNSPFTTAQNTLEEDIDFIKGTLKNSGEFHLGLLGKLKMENGNRLLFIPGNKLFENHGYPEISLSNEDQEKSSNTNDAVILEYTPSRSKTILHGLMKYAAMIVAILSLGIVLSTPISYDANTTLAELTPMSFISSPAHHESTDVEETIPEFLLANPSIHAPNATDEIDEIHVSPNNFKYCLVIASLASMEQAQEYLNQVGDDAKGIVESYGRYRVYATTGMTIAEVTDSDIMQRHPDAWPCEIKN